jgi:PPP family 3-phenylpropionic acid transporter
VEKRAGGANKSRVLGAFYFFIFVGFGSLYTLLSVFLQERGLTDGEIGTIMAMGPVMTVLFQPLWGMICDRFQAQRLVLVQTLVGTAGLALLFPLGDSFWEYLLLFAGVGVFNSSLIPIVDSLSLSHVQRHGGSYGALRLWGAIGFAVASWGAGRLAEWYGLVTIFFVYATAMLVCVLIVRALPQEGNPISVNLFAGLRELVRLPKYMLFLLATFLIFGAIQANNALYGLFFTAIGGSVGDVGLSFLIAAGCEAPVMLAAGWAIRRFGVVPLLVVAGLISGLRWLWYGMEPTPGMVMALLFVQGLSVGLFLPAAAQYVREIAPAQIQVTALAIYSAIGNGLGSMAGSSVGGLVSDSWGIFATYSMFGASTLVGVAVMAALYGMQRKKTERL